MLSREAYRFPRAIASQASPFRIGVLGKVTDAVRRHFLVDGAGEFAQCYRATPNLNQCRKAKSLTSGATHCFGSDEGAETP